MEGVSTGRQTEQKVPMKEEVCDHRELSSCVIANANVNATTITTTNVTSTTSTTTLSSVSPSGAPSTTGGVVDLVMDAPSGGTLKESVQMAVPLVVRHKTHQKEHNDGELSDDLESNQIVSNNTRNNINYHSTPLKTASAKRLIETSSPPSLSTTHNLRRSPDQSQNFYKVKKLLNTLVQFGNSIGPDVGERVKNLILCLVGNSMSIEEFHHALQDVTNYPLRSFVLPFLKSYIPILQREINHQARYTKQNIHQYLRQNESAILDGTCSPTEVTEIFRGESIVSNSEDRNKNLSESYDDGLPIINDGVHQVASNKKFTISPVASLSYNSPPLGVSLPYHPYYPTEYFNSSPLQSSAANNKDVEDRRTTTSEWNDVYMMLNNIATMAEKAKKSIMAIQERVGEQNGTGTTFDGFNRRSAEEIKKSVNDLMAQTVRMTEEKVAHVKRKAEEAVNEVKRQAVAEFQRAIATMESKAESVSLDRNGRSYQDPRLKLKYGRSQEESQMTSYHRNNDLSTASTGFSNVTQTCGSCWNCGRKAYETCSGCNVAKYCGHFCQHKDWELHHRICNKASNTYINTNELGSTNVSTSIVDNHQRYNNHNSFNDTALQKNLLNDVGVIKPPTASSNGSLKDISRTTVLSDKTKTMYMNTYQATSVSNTSTMNSYSSTKLKK